MWTVATGSDPAPTLLPRRFARWRRYAPQVVVALAFLLTLAAIENVKRYGAWGDIVAVVGVAPLAILPFRPLLAWRVAWVAGLLTLTAPGPDKQWPWYPAEIIVYLVVLFVVATRQPPRVLLWVWLFSIVLVLPFVPDDGTRNGIIFFFTLIMVVGDQIRRRIEAQRELAAEEERGLVLTERARIARELHDVVAHHMSLIAVRAETAPFRLNGLPEPAREEFVQVSREAREALTEMRRLLGVLRRDSQTPETAPQPGLADLPHLVAAARRAGADVRLNRPRDLVEVPGAVGLSAYRIVQEALSNAARHAAGAAVTVELNRTDGAIVVRVVNRPPRHAPKPSDEAGQGLIGMRERAAMLGGELVAGPTQDGGYEVRAVLPTVDGER
jgi:signal transduction histidine kinase